MDTYIIRLRWFNRAAHCAKTARQIERERGPRAAGYMYRNALACLLEAHNPR